MSVTYKDIDELSQKSSIAGTEKLPVSDTQYITPAQIVDGHPTDEELIRISGEQAPFVKLPYSILATDKFNSSTSNVHAAIRVNPGEKYIITNHQDSSASTIYTRYAFATSGSYSSSGDIPLVPGTHVVAFPSTGISVVVTIPAGCYFLLVNYTETGTYYYDVVKYGEGMKNVLPYDFKKMTPTSSTSGSYFTASGSIGSLSTVTLKKYSVTAGERYAFSGRFGTSHLYFFVSWADSNDSIFCVEPWRGAPFESAIETILFQEITAPPGAAYAYCNVQTTNDAFAAFFEGTDVDSQTMRNDEITLRNAIGYEKYPYSIATTGTGKFGSGAQYWHAAIAVVPGEKYIIKNTQTQDNSWTRYAFATTNSCESGGDIPFVADTTDVAIAVGGSATVTIPTGCSYLLISQAYATYAPISVRRDTSVSFPVSDVTLGGTSVVSSGVAALPAYPTTLPASDVYSWAKASSKPTYTASEVGALPDSTVVPNITISSSEPTSSDGSNGDIWIVV